MTDTQRADQLWRLAEQVMTPNQHLAYWLHHHEGFSNAAIADALGISRQAVQDRIAGGHKRLKEALQLDAEEAAA